MGVLISIQSNQWKIQLSRLKSAALIQKRNSPVSPASTQECVLAIGVTDWTGMEAIEWNMLNGRANLSVLPAAQSGVIAASQLLAGDLQR
jgi:hypothetical protein